MGLMDALRNLFGAGGEAGEAAPAASAVEYHGYRITPAPQRQASGWNTAGVISKDVPRRREGAQVHPRRYPREQGRRRRLLDHQGAADH